MTLSAAPTSAEIEPAERKPARGLYWLDLLIAVPLILHLGNYAGIFLKHGLLHPHEFLYGQIAIHLLPIIPLFGVALNRRWGFVLSSYIWLGLACYSMLLIALEDPRRTSFDTLERMPQKLALVGICVFVWLYCLIRKQSFHRERPISRNPAGQRDLRTQGNPKA